MWAYPRNLEVQSQSGIFGLEGTHQVDVQEIPFCTRLVWPCTAGARCWLYWHCPWQIFLVIGQNRLNTDILKMQFFLQTTRFTCVRGEPLVSKTGLGMKGS